MKLQGTPPVFKSLIAAILAGLSCFSLIRTILHSTSVQAEKNNKQHQIDALAEQYTEFGKDAPKQAKDRIKQQINVRQL